MTTAEREIPRSEDRVALRVWRLYAVPGRDERETYHERIPNEKYAEFAMFDSKADAFNSMNCPAHRDFVAEYAESCRKHGLKVGLYYFAGRLAFRHS